jgi:hypothetical protein
MSFSFIANSTKRVGVVGGKMETTDDASAERCSKSSPNGKEV